MPGHNEIEEQNLQRKRENVLKIVEKSGKKKLLHNFRFGYLRNIFKYKVAN
jgi:hypothetical protein